MTDPNSHALHVDSVAFSYPSGGPTFGPFTFSARGGQVWAVLGSNGAGKSTLFRLLSSELTPAAGSIRATGTVELIPQGLSMPGRLTVREAFEYLALVRRVPAKGRADAVERALASVNLTGHGHLRLNQLSGGQRRRAVVGQALLASPAILLMDEPSAGLDLDQRATLRDTVRRLGSERLVLISSHIVEDLAGVADHVLHIVAGRTVFAGPATEYLSVLPEDDGGNSAGVEAWTAAYRHWNTTPEVA